MTDILRRLEALEERARKRTGVFLLYPEGPFFVLQGGNKRQQYKNREAAKNAYKGLKKPGSVLIEVDV